MDYRALLPFLPIVLLPLGFFGVGWLLSVVSGWRAHASRHPDRETTGTRLSGVSGRVGWVNFNHVLTLHLDARGIRFSVFRLFPGFRPFHLAWRDISSLEVVPGLFRRRLDIVP
ncbi:MAG TPA: hypothetical protein VFL14_16590, partial [Xanthomonadales bacterium]|nr:hypothetical protein [Xanthomonadales bacterium]